MPRKKGGKKKEIKITNKVKGLIAAAKRTGKPMVVRTVKERSGKAYSEKRDMSRTHTKGRKVLPPGWRVSKSGRLYFENRVNRSDLPKSNI